MFRELRSEAVLDFMRGNLGSGVRGVTACVTASLFILALAGCGSTNPARSPSTTALSNNGDVEQRLRVQEQRWHGAPYRWGGASRDGVDCSGFVMTLYRDLFDLSLPRTTAEQVQVGQAVLSGEFQAGDLVFFRPSGGARHVGLYLSAGEFAHASTSEGVTISHLDEAYWREAYWTTRRVLPTAETPPPSDVDKERPSKRRVGW